MFYSFLESGLSEEHSDASGQHRYSDHNCGTYKDSTYFSRRSIHENTGSAGSALFVTTDGCGSKYRFHAVWLDLFQLELMSLSKHSLLLL
jgi:hypothetical protein